MSPDRKRPRLRRWLLVAGVATALYAIAGFLIAPPIVRSLLVRTLAEKLHRQVSLARLRINPFVLSATADGFRIQDKDQAALVSWDRLYVNFQLLSLVQRDWIFRQFQLVNFAGRLVMLPDGSLNISDIVASLSGPPAPNAPPAEMPLVRIGRLRIHDARLDFVDRSRPSPFATRLGPVRIDLRSFGTHRDNKNPYSFAGKTESGESFSWSGFFYLDPIRSGGQFTLGNIQLTKYKPYYDKDAPFELKDGAADLSASYQFEWAPTRHVMAISEGHLAVSGLKISERGLAENAVDVPSLELSGAKVDALTGEASLASVATRDGSLILRQYADGTINLRKMIEPLLTGEPIPGGVPEKIDRTAPPPATPAPEKPGPVITIAEVRFDNYKILAEDLVPKRPVRLHFDQVQMLMHNVDNRVETTSNGTLSLRWEEGGTASLAGDLALLKLQGNLDVKFDGVDVSPLDPYVDPLADARVTSGKLSAAGKLKVNLLDPQHPTFSYLGSLILEDFAAVDGPKQEELLKFKRLEMSPVDYVFDPEHLNIGEVLAEAPVARLAVTQDGSNNVFRALRIAPPPPEEPATTAQGEGAGSTGGTAATGPSPAAGSVSPAANPPSVRPAAHASTAAPSGGGNAGLITIKRVRVSGGKIRYEDQSVQPNVRFSLDRLHGTIAGLSSKELARADVSLEARVENVSAVKLYGKINPLCDNQYTDLTLQSSGVDLMPLGPYSGKYLGYAFKKGKLDLDMKYLVSSRSLQATNVITIDQLMLGEKVESPDATKLPVKLGVALLKDRHGVIKLDVPVEGNLDDPKFRLGRVILHAIGVVFAKIVTSPFTLLARAFGGSEEDLSNLDFDPGSEVLTPGALEKLNLLITSLYERPALTLEIRGAVDEAADRDGLKQTKLSDMLRKQKWEEMSKKERAAMPPESVTVAEGEEAALLKQVFKTAWSKRATTAPSPAAREAAAPTQEVKPETAEEMEAWLLARLEVSAEDLRALAAARATSVRDYILGTGKVETERIFLAETASAEGAGAGVGSRVYLTLD